jgi:hypothetical protein
LKQLLEAQLAALGSLQDWSKWLVGIDAGVLGLLVFAAQRIETSPHPPAKAIFLLVLAIVSFCLSLLIASWLVGAVPAFIMHLKADDTWNNRIWWIDWRANNIYGFRFGRIPLQVYAFLQHLFFMAGVILLTISLSLSLGASWRSASPAQCYWASVKEVDRMSTDISVLRDFVAVIALVVAMVGAVVAVVTLIRNSRVQKAQFIANLVKDLFQDGDLRKFYYKVDYEKFHFDPEKVSDFKESEDERHLDALLYHYNTVGRLVRLGVISQDDVEFLLFEIVQVFKNSEVEKYIAWLDSEFKKFGAYGYSQRRRPVDDARWLLEQVGGQQEAKKTPKPGASAEGLKPL